MERLLYSEITALSNKHGYCTAGNGYFSELYEVATATVSRWISNLKSRGYISVWYPENMDSTKRRIYPSDSPHTRLTKTSTPPSQKDQTPLTKKSNPVSQKDQTPFDENVKHNITSTNTTRINTTRERAAHTREENRLIFEEGSPPSSLKTEMPLSPPGSAASPPSLEDVSPGSEDPQVSKIFPKRLCEKYCRVKPRLIPGK